jgi:hypothetical protein
MIKAAALPLVAQVPAEFDGVPIALIVIDRGHHAVGVVDVLPRELVGVAVPEILGQQQPVGPPDVASLLEGRAILVDLAPVAQPLGVVAALPRELVGVAVPKVSSDPNSIDRN